MKIIRKVRQLYHAIKFARISVKAEELQSNNKYKEAHELLLTIKDIAYERHYNYHLNIGRILSLHKREYLTAIKEFDIAVSLIKKAING